MRKSCYGVAPTVVAGTVVAALLCSASQGCSGKQEGASNGRAVAGTVTYQGAPVPGAYVTFASAHDSAFGQTDAEGKFKLAASGGDQIPLGDYQVSIVKKDATSVPNGPEGPELDPEHPEQYQFTEPSADAPPAPQPKDLLPEKYADPASSGLTASVTPDGKNEFEFALSD